MLGLGFGFGLLALTLALTLTPTKEGTPLDAKSGFAEYRKCINSKPHLLRFRRLLRGAQPP